MTFAFESTSGQWTCSTENWTSAFCKFSNNNILSAILSHSLCGLSSLIEYHFFSEPGPINDHCPFPNLFAKRETRLAFDMHSFSLSLDPQEMSLNIDMKIILPVKFSGVSPNFNNKLLTSSLSCNVLNPGKIFHSKSIGSPSILSKFLYSGDDLNHPNLSSHASFDGGFSCILPRHTYRIRKDVDLCALKIDDSFFTSQRQVFP